ncbi:iron-sulfur cluster repair di-iron protein [Candidatus Poribacteria bacterium]|nr:iron-sulfur cluster repair di-iron protein [Candidatus Poribacteria bacterium]
MAEFNEKTTVRDLAAKYSQVRPVFERYGIDYCCGGLHDLETAAAEKGVGVEMLIEALGDAIKSPVSGQAQRDWSKSNVTDLADHIEKRHHTFMKEQLPRLAGLMATVLEAHGARHGDMLKSLKGVFESLRSEIEQHLMKEEQILFPYIRRIDEYAIEGGDAPEAHCGTVQNPIRQMEYEHDNAGRALAKMRELTSNYTLPGDACNTFRALYDGLKALEGDLHEHIHLENNILFPKAVETEKKLTRKDE